MTLFGDVTRIIRTLDARRKFFSSIPRGSRVLDIGCGSGKCASEIRGIDTSLEIHGVDLLPRDAVPPFVHYRRVDIDERPLPYKKEHFDAVLLVHVLEHLHHPMNLAGEIGRVLKPGGLLYVETPNWTSALVPSFGFQRAQHNPFNFFDDPTHVKPWSKQGLYEFVHACGLRTKRVGTVRNWVRMPVDPFIVLFGILFSRRDLVVSAFWNLLGWRVYARGKKQVLGVPERGRKSGNRDRAIPKQRIV